MQNRQTCSSKEAVISATTAQNSMFLQMPGVESQMSEALVGAAIHQQSLSGDEAGALRGEPHDGISDLLRLGNAAHRSVGGPAFVDVLFRDSARQRACGREFFQA